MEEEIDRNRPLPRRRSKKATREMYSFDKLEIGDCLIVDGAPGTGSTTNAPAYFAARDFRDHNDWFNFTARKLPDRPGKIGIWRIAPDGDNG